jgi:hypothetical protein
VVSIPKPGKDPTLLSYRPISLLDTIGKLLKKILLTMFLWEVNEHGPLRDEQFGFRSRHSTTLQLVHLVERVNGIFDEKRFASAFFFDVAKAFNTIWVKGPFYKLTILNFPSYLVKTVSSYLDCSNVPNILPVSYIGLVSPRVDLSPLCCSVCF